MVVTSIGLYQLATAGLSHTGPVVVKGSALRAAELGDDPVPVAPVDRLDELDRAALLVAARPLEEERGRMERHAEGRGLLTVRHRRLDRLRAARDLDPVAVTVELVERTAQILRLEARYERLREVGFAAPIMTELSRVSGELLELAGESSG